MKIYKPDNTLLFDIPVNDSSFATDEIMNEDVLMLEYELVEHLDVPVDSYCTFMGKTYYLMADSDITKRSVRNHYYKLVMYTDTSKSKDVRYGFATVTRTSGQPPVFDVAKKIEFSLTGKPIDFAQLWVDNMNEAEGSNEWEVGDCIDAPLQTIDFSDQTCFDVLGQVTTAFNTEWEITGKTLSFKPLEKSKDAPIPLSYGYDNGLLSGVSRVNYSDGKVINRLIMKGSDRNIVFETYGDTKLNLPKNYTIKFDGNYFSDEPEFVDSPAAIEYKTDANGSYVERSDRTGRVREDSLDCTTIYPMHEGTITSVDPDNNLIFFDSANIINYTDALIAGNTMQLIPQSGDLVGREFDVNYNHANKRFTLVRIEGNNDLSFPNNNLKPKVGDKYAVFKIALPQQYIDDAELTALKACVRHLYNNEVPQYTYEGELSELYAKQHWLEIGSKLQKGYFVNISDNEILPDGATIRIIKTEYYVNKPQQPKIYLSNKVTGKASTNRKNQIVNQEQTIDRSREDSIQFAKRRFRDAQETMEMLQNSLLNFTEGISPINVNTMQLLVGDPILQFRFVDGKTDPITVLPHNISYDDVTKKLYCPDGILQHMTIGIDNITSERSSSEYFFWDMNYYLSPTLDNPDKRYYLYAKCAKTGNKTDGTGVFLLSETAIGMNADSGYYYFLVGFLNSEYENSRSFVSMYGFSEILPGRMTTDRIVSSDGLGFWDFVNNAFKIGDSSSSIDWNVTAANQLTIKGIINALAAQLGGFSIDNSKLQSIAIDGNGNPLIWLNGATGDAFISGSFKGNITSIDDEFGYKIILDVKNKSIQLRDSQNRVFGVWNFDRVVSSVGSIVTYKSDIHLYNNVYVSGAYNGAQSYDTNYSPDGLVFSKSGGLTPTLTIDRQLPVSGIGRSVGTVYNDSGTLKIVI